MKNLKTLLGSVALAAGLIVGSPALCSADPLVSHVDVFATAPVSAKPGNLGAAVGVRLGKGQGLSLSPLANFTRVNGKTFVTPGVALTQKVGVFDVGVAEIGSQRNGSNLNVLNNHYETEVVAGFRL